MIFKRHAKKKEEEAYYKLTEDEVRDIKRLLIYAQCWGSQHMMFHAGSVLDKIKCEKEDEIKWNKEYETFCKEAKLVDEAIEEVFTILNRNRTV